MITDRDITTRVVAEAADPKMISVGDVYSRDLISVEPDQGLEEALRLMARHQVRRLPVIENGSLVGIVAQAVSRSGRRSLSPQRESAGSVARTARPDDRSRDARSAPTPIAHTSGRCSECVRGRLPLPEALRDELGPLPLTPALQHLEV
jgi:CBS-domain-containing membrane protein